MQEEYLNKLFSLHSFGVKLGLDNIKKFLLLLGNPHEKLKTFHIAGSNGKGSTSAFLASILKEFHYKVGLYTSPHFVRFNERIKIGSKEIPDDYIARFIMQNEKSIDDLKLTFFEVTTAMAFKYFYEEKVDFAVIETGLGGRLDATNVINPIASIITSISLEHTNILGDTIEKIAAEKAGIIKNRCKVFTGKLPQEAISIIEDICSEKKCELFKIEDYIIEKKDILELYTEEIELDDWTMPLKGKYQKYNAALAGLAVAKCFNASDINKICHGITNVIQNTGIQGRFEYFNRGPDIIFDSAHNPESLEHFLSEFQKDSHRYKKRVILFGILKDKAVHEMLEMLKGRFDEIVLTEVNNERSSKIEDLKKLAEELNIKTSEARDPGEFVMNFKNNNSNYCLVVLGSMYLLGEIKTILKH